MNLESISTNSKREMLKISSSIFYLFQNICGMETIFSGSLCNVITEFRFFAYKILFLSSFIYSDLYNSMRVKRLGKIHRTITSTSGILLSFAVSNLLT